MLSTYVWNVKENSHKQPQVNFKIKKNILSYRPEIEKCNLCIGEKKEIILADENKIINRNDEILTKCRHRNKYLLQNWIQNKRKRINNNSRQEIFQTINLKVLTIILI